MSDLYYLNPESLNSLLQAIHEGKLVLPSFQRKFNWDPPREDALIRTMVNSYPAGSLLFLQQPPKEESLGKRLISGVDPSKENVHPDRIILDGQQRLTTLYHVLYETGEGRARRAIIDLQKVDEFFNREGKLPDSNEELGSKLVKESLLFMNANEAKIRFGSLKEQFDKHVLPLTTVFGKEEAILEDGTKRKIGIDEWKDKYAEYHEPHDRDARLALKRKLDEIKRRFIKPIEDCEFPAILLREKTESQAVCQVFVDLNIQQLPLNSFEVVAAKVWPFKIDLYTEWEEAEKIRTIKEFSIDWALPLKMIALLQTSERQSTDSSVRISCTKKALYQLEPDTFMNLWKKAIHSLNKSLLLLEGECGVLHPSWLPYSALLAAMASTFVISETSGLPKEDAKRKLQCWFWCSVFAGTYMYATNSQNAQDFVQLKDWLNDGELPYTVKNFSSLFNPAILRTIASKFDGRYKGVICLLLRRHAKDFQTGQGINTSLLLQEKINDHHVFPDAYLKRIGLDDWTRRNCILNRALIDASTNQNIGDQAPSQYLESIKRKIGETQLKEILESQLLPTEPDSGLFKDDYERFLQERERKVHNEIKKVTSLPA